MDAVTPDERTVHVDKSPGALIGVRLMDTGFLWSRRVIVSHVDSDSSARGKLEVGYEVRAVNGVAARSAAAASDLMQAAGGTLLLSLKPPRPRAAGDSSPFRCFGWSPRVAIAILLGVAALCGANAWSSSSVSRAAAQAERAKSDAAQWRTIAKAEAKKLEEGNAVQQDMARRALKLQQRIRLLRRANETASSRIGETISALRAQHRNLTEQRRAWRRTQHEHQQKLKDLRSESSSIEASLASERQRAKEAEKQLSEARAEAMAALTRERALVLQMRQKIRQRMMDAAKELEDMMLAAQARDPTSAVTNDRVDFAALISQLSGVPATRAGSPMMAGKEGVKRGGKRDRAKSGGDSFKRKEARAQARTQARKEGTGLSEMQRSLPLCARGPTSFAVEYDATNGGGEASGHGGDVKARERGGGGGGGGGSDRLKSRRGDKKKRDVRYAHGRRLGDEDRGMGRGGLAGAALPPCCTENNPEPYRMGRCAFLADRGKCVGDPSAAYCPVACEKCRICDGHPLLESYQKMFAKRKKPPSYDVSHTAHDKPSSSSSSASIDPHPASVSSPPPKSFLSVGMDLVRTLVSRAGGGAAASAVVLPTPGVPRARVELATCAQCVSDGGASGAFELEQYEKWRAAGGEAGASSLTVGARASYVISNVVAAAACLHLTITAARHSGGTSFRAVIDGGAVEMCCVRDAGDGRYSVTCPRRALDADGCGQILIELGFERFG